MDAFQLIANFWWLGIPVAFIMGVLLAANPLALPMLGTAVGLGASGALGTRGGALRLTGAFGAGMVAIYGLVGFLFGAIGSTIEEFLRSYAGIGYLILGLALSGLALLLLVKPNAFCAACAMPVRKNTTMLGAFVAGIPAGFVNCPACAGVVLGVAASAAELGNAFYSGTVMLALGVGHAGMLVGITHLITSGWAPNQRTLRILQRVLALLILALAGYFFYLASVQGLRPGFRLV